MIHWIHHPKKTQKTPQNATKKKSKQQQTTKTSPSFGTTPRSRPPLKLCVPLGWNPWLCPVPNLARKMTTQNGQNGGIPKHFQRIPCFATSFLGGSESKNVDGTLSWDLYNSYKSMLDYITWGFCLEWKCCRKFGCPFAHAFAVHGSCTTPVWFQHPNKKSQGSTARFLKRPSLGSWCPFPTIPALKQEVSKAVDLCKILILEPWIFLASKSWKFQTVNSGTWIFSSSNYHSTWQTISCSLVMLHSIQSSVSLSAGQSTWMKVCCGRGVFFGAWPKVHHSNILWFYSFDLVFWHKISNEKQKTHPLLTKYQQFLPGPWVGRSGPCSCNASLNEDLRTLQATPGSENGMLLCG